MLQFAALSRVEDGGLQPRGQETVKLSKHFKFARRNDRPSFPIA